MRFPLAIFLAFTVGACSALADPPNAEKAAPAPAPAPQYVERKVTKYKSVVTDKVVDQDGRTVKEIDPEKMSTVMSPSSASEVNQMMQSVVREGTGTASALDGIDVAGKTGTAEVNKRCPNQAWFIGFAPAECRYFKLKFACRYARRQHSVAYMR